MRFSLTVLESECVGKQSLRLDTAIYTPQHTISVSIQVRRSAPKVLNMPRLFLDNGLKDRVGYLDNALKQIARAPKQPLKGDLRTFCWCYYKVVIRKRFLACPGLSVQTSVQTPPTPFSLKTL